MKIIKNIIIVVVVFILGFFTSSFIHTDRGVEFEIINQSGTGVSDVSISTSESLVTVSLSGVLQVNESFRGFLPMDHNRQDGNYRIWYRSGGKNKELSSGYYTNGTPMDTHITLIMQPE